MPTYDAIMDIIKKVAEWFQTFLAYIGILDAAMNPGMAGYTSVIDPSNKDAQN